MVPRRSALGFKEKQNMLTTSASIALGLAFVLLGGINVWLVLEAESRVKAAKASSRLLALHRIGGYLFIGLFCVMAYFMVARLRNGGGDTSPTVTAHLALAMISYLASQNRPEGSAITARMEIARALVDQRCGRCHNLDRVYKTVQMPEQWRETVTRMVGYAADSTGALQPGEDQQIMDYL